MADGRRYRCIVDVDSTGHVVQCSFESYQDGDRTALLGRQVEPFTDLELIADDFRGWVASSSPLELPFT